MSLLHVWRNVCMAPFHMRSKLCIAPIHLRSKLAVFSPRMGGSNADSAPHVEVSHANFASHMEQRHSFITKSANFQRHLINLYFLGSNSDLFDTIFNKNISGRVPLSMIRKQFKSMVYPARE